MKFDQAAAQLIFGGGKDCLFVFVDADGEASNKAMAALEDASTKLKGNILMSYSGNRDGMDATL